MPTYTFTTLEELREVLTALVGDNTVFWGAEEKKDAINEAIALWQGLVGEWETSFDIPVTIGEFFYSVPRQIMSVKRVLWNGAALVQLSITELDRSNPGWPLQVPGTPLYWAPNGINEVVLFPAPDVDGLIRIEGYQDYPMLASGGEFINIGEEELNAFLLYAHHYLSFKEAGAELNATLENVGEFVKLAVDRNDELLATQMYRKYLGLDREESERPQREGTTSYGIRGMSAK